MSFLYVALTLGVTLAGLLLFSLLDMAQKSEEYLDRQELEMLRTKAQTFPSRKGRTDPSFGAACRRFVLR